MDIYMIIKKRILVDLDGVLNNYDSKKYDENYIPEIKDGAKEFIQNLSLNYELYLFTSRNLILAVKWLIKNGLDMYFRDVTNIKIPSFLYIDDRAICFKGNYDRLADEIKKFKV